MPATFMTYPNGGPILPVTRMAPRSGPSQLLLDWTYLSSFGEMRVPRHLWTALQRFDVWVEPALVAEWSRLIKFYASRQGRSVDDAAIAAAMTWNEPARDVGLARERALGLAAADQLFCVWSGRRLINHSLDVDHCLPWSAWPCGDLWNLMPSHRSVNQKEKRARLPSDRVLRTAQDRILHWWEGGFIAAGPFLAQRFWLEANSSLPSMRIASTSMSDLFDALCLQRMRLRHDQQVPEWGGEPHVVGG